MTDPTEIDELIRERDEAKRNYNEFIEGLTAKLQGAGVPATPSWPDAIDYLIRKSHEAPNPLDPCEEWRVKAFTLGAQARSLKEAQERFFRSIDEYPPEILDHEDTWRLSGVARRAWSKALGDLRDVLGVRP